MNNLDSLFFSSIECDMVMKYENKNCYFFVDKMFEITGSLWSEIVISCVPARILIQEDLKNG